MKPRAPITDIIDVRNFNDELKHSIVKRSCVRYIPNEVVQESQSVKEEVDTEILATAHEIYQRLKREAKEDEEAKRIEWESKIAQQKRQEEEIDESLFNKTTGSYSGVYGQGEVSAETKEMAATILGKKDTDLTSLIKDNTVGNN